MPIINEKVFKITFTLSKQLMHWHDTDSGQNDRNHSPLIQRSNLLGQKPSHHTGPVGLKIFLAVLYCQMMIIYIHICVNIFVIPVLQQVPAADLYIFCPVPVLVARGLNVLMSGSRIFAPTFGCVVFVNSA